MRAFSAGSPAFRAVVAVAGTSLFMVLVAWATLIGPDEVFTGPGPRPATLTTQAESCIPLPVVTGPDGTATTTTPGLVPSGGEYCDPPDTSLEDAREMARRADPPLWIKLLVWIFELVLLAAIATLLAYLVVVAARAVRRSLRSTDRRVAVDFATLDEPVRLAEEIVGDADEHDALLREGEPRNAIVAAWHRFEVQGARAGVSRRMSETSSEYSIRILDLVEADTGSVSRLARLYREARFSDHPITEEHRSEALAALAAIRESLAVRT